MVELHYAAFSGDIELVKDLLHKNYDPFDEISDLQFEFEDEVCFHYSFFLSFTNFHKEWNNRFCRIQYTFIFYFSCCTFWKKRCS